MHELSIVLSIVDIAREEAIKAHVTKIDDIELEIGMLSGIEMSAFDFAWAQAVRSTVLDKATLNIIRPSGKAVCLECETHFDVSSLYDPCPVCQSYFSNILQGKELRVKSLGIE